jgi:hypothetical protein
MTTVSAPSGIGAPVVMRMQWPSSTRRPIGAARELFAGELQGRVAVVQQVAWRNA